MIVIVIHYANVIGISQYISLHGSEYFFRLFQSSFEICVGCDHPAAGRLSALLHGLHGFVLRLHHVILLGHLERDALARKRRLIDQRVELGLFLGNLGRQRIRLPFPTHAYQGGQSHVIEKVKYMGVIQAFTARCIGQGATQSGEDGVADLLDFADAVYLDVTGCALATGIGPFRVVVDQRLGLVVVDTETLADGCFLVIIALDQRLAGLVILALFLRRIEDSW